MALTGLTNLQPLHVHSIGISTFDGSVSVGGTLTYEDVTNVDSIGIITARSGINISDTTQASSTTTGALKVAGGVGVVKNLQVGGSITGIGTLAASNATFNASAGYSVIANGSSTGIGVGSNGIIVFGNQNIAAYGPGVFDATQYQFKTSGNERLRITSTGKVNIGDTQMSQNILNIEDGTAAALDIASHGTGGDTAYIGVKKSSGGGLTFGISNRDIIFKTGASYSSGTTFDSGTERLRITSTGQVSVGTASPQTNAKLQVEGNVGSSGYFYTTTTSSPQTDFTSSIASNKAGLLLHRSSETNGDYGGLEFHNHPSSITTYRKGGIYFQSDGSGFGRGDIVIVNDGAGDSANLAISDEKMRIHKEGYVTKPYQVAWAMHGTGAQNVTSGTRLNFNVNGSGFGNFSNRNHGGVDTTNNSFTVPVTGLYCIILTVFCYTDNNTSTFSFVPYKNGTAMHNGNDTIFVFGASAVNANITYSGSILLQLNANDEIDIRRRSGEAGTSRVYLAHSHFSGFLVG